MFHQWLFVIQTFLIISTFKSVYSWNPQCSPCRCFDQNNKKISDCSSSVTSLPLTKIPDLKIETETVFLIGQQLQTIPQDGFFKGSSNNLKFIDLKNCKVRTIHANAFRNLKYLSGLDLSHNELSQLDENVFGLNNKLRILILQYNNLKVFPETIFHNLPELKYLDISENKLHYIYPNQFKSNTNLERLIIQSNYLTKIDQALISSLPNLNVMYFDNNPWKCDCQTRDLQKLIIDRKIDFIDNDIYPLCSKPKQYNGKKWLEVKPKDLCSVPSTPTKTVSEGDNFVVDCILEATNNNLAVEWLFNGQSLDTSNSQKYQLSSVKNSPNTFSYKLTINDIKFADIGVYKCWTSNLKGSDIQYEETVLNVTPGIPPKRTGPENQNKLVKNGEINYKLPCDISGSPTPKIEWLFNGKILTFSESNCQRSKTKENSLLYSQLNPSCFGNYICRATNSKGVAEQKYVLQPLPQKPPTIQPLDPTIDNSNPVEGTSVSLNCYVAEPLLLEVQWLRNGQVISPNNRYNIKVNKINPNTYNYILTINDISLNEGGNYKCRANSVESPDFTLTVTPGTPPRPTGPPNQPKLVKNGEINYKLPCDISGSPTPEIEWLFNGKILTFSESNCQRSKTKENSLLYSKVNLSCFGNYTCRATNSKGVAEQKYVLQPLPQNQPTIQPLDPTIDNSNPVEGTSVSLNCYVAEPLLVKVEWLRNGQVISPNNRYNIRVNKINSNTYNYILTINDISLNEGGNYKCRANSVESPDFTLTVTPGTPPRPTGPPNQPKLVKNGELNYKLPCDISGSPTPTIEWLFNGKTLTFSESNCQRSKTKENSLLYSQVNLSCFGNYTCRATNSKGVAEQNYELQPLPQKPPAIKSVDPTIDNTNPVEGTSVSLNCYVAEPLLVKVEWLRNGQVLSLNNRYNIKVIKINANSYNYILTINDISLNEGGNYKCRANSVESPDYTLTVTPGTTPRPTGPPNQPKLVKNGELNYKLPCDISGSPTPKIEWFFNGKSISFSESNCQRSKSDDNSLLYSQVNPSCFGNYTCRATNSKGVAEQNYVLQPLPQKPPKIVSVDPTIDNSNPVEGTSVSLNCYVAEPLLVKVEWLRNDQVISPNNRYNIKVTKINTNTYNYILTINGISFNEGGNYKCRANSVESPEFTINVEKGVGPSIEDFENDNEIILQPGEDQDVPCKANGLPKPTITWILPQSDCNVDTIAQGDTLYLRNVNCPGRYKCVVTNSKGRTEKEFTLAIVKPKVTDTGLETGYNESDTTISEYDDIILVCLVEGSVTPQPYWEFNNKPISNNNKYKLVKIPNGKNKYYYNLEIKNIAILDRGNYKCRIGSDSKTVTVDVKPVKIPKIDSIPDPNTIVEEDTKDFKLECRVSGSHPNVVWTSSTKDFCKYEQTIEDRGDHKVAVLTIKEVYTYCKGQYKCKVNNKQGGDEKVVNLDVVPVLPPPQPEIVSPTNNEAVENEEVTLRCLIRGAVKSEPRWSFNGNFDPNKYKIEKQIISDTSYWYNLIIKDLKPEDGGNYKCVIGKHEQNIVLDIKPSVKPTIDYISNSQTIEAGRKNFRIACKVTGSPKPKTTWVKSGSFDGCQHQVTRDVTGTTELIYLSITEVNPSCSGRYTCVATSSKGETRMDVEISVISINEPPQVIIDTPSTDNEVIENEEVTLKCFIKAQTFEPEWIHQGQVVRTNNKYKIETIGVNQTSYWFNLIISNISPQEQGAYKCRVNNFESEVLVNVKKSTKPVIEDISNPNTVEEGKKDFTLSCKVSGTPKPNVQWYYEGQQINKNQFSCKYIINSKVVENTEFLYLTIRNVEQSCAGKYKCIAENSKGGEENEVNLSVVTLNPPEIIQPPKNVFENSNVTLQCLIKGSIDSKPIWLHNNQPIDIKRANKYKLFMIPLNDGISYMFNLEILNISPLERGNYKCKINNMETEITLKPQPGMIPQISRIPPSDLDLKEGTKQITLPCQATGDPIPKITWLYENIPIEQNAINNCQYKLINEQIGNQRQVNLIIQNVGPYCAGKYKCRATNLKGSNERDVNITVISIPPPFVEAIPPSGSQIVENGEVTLKCLVPKIYTAEWYIKNEPLIMEPNSRYSIDITPGNDTTNYWYNLVISNLMPSDKGQYKCKINSPNILESPIELEVLTPVKPIIKYIPTKDTIVQEGTKDFRLACQVSGIPKPQASWQYEDNSVNSQLAGNICKHTITSEVNENSEWIYLTIAEVTPACSGTYKCITKNSAGSDLKEINLSVTSAKQTLQITTSSTSTDGVNREHDDVTLRCLSTSNARAEWYLNKKPIDFRNDDRYQVVKQEFNPMTIWTILTIKNVTLTDKGDYTCKVNNVEQTHYLEIERGLIPTVEYLINTKLIVDENTETTVLPCKVTDSPDDVAEWTFNGQSIDQSSCGNTAVSYEKTRHFEWYNLTIVNITASCSGKYKCIVRSSRNIDNNEINLTVLPIKPLQINVTSPHEIISEQDSVTLKCLITSGNTNAAKWIYNGKVIATDSIYRITKLIIDETSYWYNLEIPKVSIQESGEYKCSTERSEITHIVNVYSGFKPTIELTSNTEMIIEGDTKEVTLFCKANGSPTPTIKWYHQNKGVIKRGDCKLQSHFETNANSQINYLTITNLNPTCSGKLICAVSNSKGNAEKIINLTVMPTQKPELTINSTSPDNIIREGDDVTFSCLSTGKNKEPTNWLFRSKYGDINANLRVNTHEINPLTYRHDVIIKNITLKQAGTYTCKKGAIENVVKIDVQPGVVPAIEQTNSENVVIDTNVKETTLFCKVAGVPRPEVTWLFYDKPLDLSSQSKCKYQIYSSNQWNNLTIQDASPSCAGFYKCVARSFKGRTEKQITVRVINPQAPELTVKPESPDSGDTDIIKENDKVTLRCLVRGDINTAVSWLHNGQNIRIDNNNHKIIKEKENDVSFWYNLQIERITFAQGGRYQCKTPTSLSNPINVNVQSTTKPSITLAPPLFKRFVQSGAEDLTISCIENGVPIPSGTWEYNNIPVDKISECANSCQYRLTNITNAKTERRLQLTLTNIVEACSGKYKCIAESSAGKSEKIVEIVVIPPGQPKVFIQEPVNAVLNTNVIISCEVTSVDVPVINWKYNGKTVNSVQNKYVISKGTNANNLHYANLTIINFQQSNYGDYTCEGNLDNIQNIKTVSLKAKSLIKPEFIKPKSVLDSFKIVGDDIVLITKVKAYPKPKLMWKYDDRRTIKVDNTKYLSKSSYISDDQYWFNQTIKNANVGDTGVHGFILQNEAGAAKRKFFVEIEEENEEQDIKGRISVQISNGIVQTYDNIQIVREN